MSLHFKEQIERKEINDDFLIPKLKIIYILSRGAMKY